MLFRNMMMGVVLALSFARPATAQSLTLKGPADQSRVLSGAEIAALPHQAMTMTDHGRMRTYSGVPISMLTALVGEALRGKAMTDIVVVSAADGYRVVLSLAETDPAMRSEPILLADRADGLALDAHEGPFRLVVGGDKRPARSARQVETIEVRAIP